MDKVNSQDGAASNQSGGITSSAGKDSWVDLGPASDLQIPNVREVTIGRVKIALSYKDGVFGAVAGTCNHVGGPLGQGTMEGDYLVCPWHAWRFHHVTGEGEPGYEADRVPRYELKQENGHLFVNASPVTKRNKLPHAAHPLSRNVERGDGPIRVLGLSTTAMDAKRPRYSTSDALLETALKHGKESLGAETKLIKLNDLKFRTCEGYYSKSSRACTWPCSITQMDADDQLDAVFEAIVHWADVVIVSTSIRWGNASSLYYKFVERMNCVQNQITTHNQFLIKNKVAGFIITGGQDNVQAVAGQMLGFFSEIGFVFSPYPFIAHSRGWDAEDMERNISHVAKSKELHEGAQELLGRAVALASTLLQKERPAEAAPRGGRKAHRLDVEA